jgi:hypothetical protein
MKISHLCFALIVSTFLCLMSPLALAASDNCLAVNGTSGRPTSAIVGTSFSYAIDPATGNTIFTYIFAGLRAGLENLDSVISGFSA